MKNEKSKYHIKLQENVEDRINKGLSIFEYLQFLIVPKTYGTFRIYAQPIESILEKYEDTIHITKEEVASIRKLMRDKRNNKMKISSAKVDFEAYIGRIGELAELSIDAISRKSFNVFFLIPMLGLPKTKYIMEIMLKDIFIEKSSSGSLLTFSVEDEGAAQKFHIFLKEHGDLYAKVLNHLKETSDTDSYLFPYANASSLNRKYRILGDEIEEELSNYITGDEMNQFNLSPLKNAKHSYENHGLSKVISLF